MDGKGSWTRLGGLLLAASLAVGSCGRRVEPATALPAVLSATLAPASTDTATVEPTKTATLLPTDAPATATPTAVWQVCSPLEGVGLDELAGMVSNPYAPPPAGSDNPHQGVDLAQVNALGVALAGMPVRAVLDGQVAAVIVERFPYGNAILIETRLDGAAQDWAASLRLPTPAPTLEAIPALTCPEGEPFWLGEGRSLYLLYAHLQAAPQRQVGEAVRCGETIGAVGDSGNALNPHLHLEARVGPAGARFGSMAHYDVSASAAEMYVYCVWRVSGLFQVIDPLGVVLGAGGE